MDSRLFLRGALLSLVWAAVICPACDNEFLSDETAIEAFGAQSASTTWINPMFGLTWQVTPTGGSMSWAAAESHCATLSLDGGGWRLPTIWELRHLIRGCTATESLGACEIRNGSCLAWECRSDNCDGCPLVLGPDVDCFWPEELEGDCRWYWSSSAVEDGDSVFWGVDFEVAGVTNALYDASVLVRCVR